MIYLNLTRPLAKALEIKPEVGSDCTHSVLGNWCARDVPTSGGTLVLLTNEKTLLSIVMVPGPNWDIRKDFGVRLLNLLGMLNIPPNIAADELFGASELRFGKAKDQRVLGSSHNAAQLLIQLTDDPGVPKPISASDTELKLADWPYGALKYKTPREVAMRVLGLTRAV